MRSLDFRIEQSLRRSIAVPDLGALVSRVEAMARSMQQAQPASRTMRWLAMGIGLLLLSVAMCASKLVRAEASPADVEVAQSWSDSVSASVAMSVVGASAALAQTIRLRKDRRGRRQLLRDGGVLDLPDAPLLRAEDGAVAGACTLVFQGPTGPVALLVLPRDRDPKPAFAACQPALPHRFFRRELGPFAVYEANRHGRALLVDQCGAR